MEYNEIIEQLQNIKQDPVAQGATCVDTVLRVMAVDQAIQIITDVSRSGISNTAAQDQVPDTLELERAIRHAKEVAENWKSELVNCVSEEGRNNCLARAAEHEQIAAWLTELLEHRSALPDSDK